MTRDSTGRRSSQGARTVTAVHSHSGTSCHNLYILLGMTNYRIDRIGTDFGHIDTAKQGQGYESIVSRYEYWAKVN